MRRNEPLPVALPVLAWGLFGGLAASMFCACWVVSVPAGWGAVRFVARSRKGRLSSSGAVGIGLATGLVLGLVTASFGTLMFLKSLDANALEESARMTSALLGQDTDVSTEAAALGHAFLAFWVNLAFGLIGGLLGAASLPRDGEEPPAPPQYRFEPRQPVTPPSAPEPEEVAEPTDPFAQVPRSEVPAEAFQSAWASRAEGGTPRRAAQQPPPPNTDEHLRSVGDPADGEDQQTIMVGAAGPDDAATIAVRPARPGDAED